MGAIFNVLFQALAWTIAAFYSVTHNYAFSILGLTITIMAVTYPLTAKQTRNMIALNQLQPEIKKLQELHKEDKQKQSEELMALYKKHGINPFGGCLPMLLQFPVFIVMFRVIEGLTHVDRPAGLGVGIDNVSKVLSSGQALVVHATPKYISHGTRLYSDLRVGQGHMKAFGFDLASKANQQKFLSTKFIPFAILLALSAATQFISTKQIYARNKQMSRNNAQAQQMMRMQYFFVAFFVYFGLHFQAAVLLYWVSQGALRIFQQWAMYKYDRKLVSLLGTLTNEIEGEIAEAKSTKSKSKRTTLPKRISGRNGKGKK